MLDLFKTKIGRLRLIAFFEGASLLALTFIAVPMKYVFGNPSSSKTIGPIYGALFLLFLLNTFSVALEQRWKFSEITWKVLLACLIPFGTFYVDHKILKNIEQSA